MAPFRVFEFIAEWRRRRDERLWQDFEAAKASAAALGMRMGDVVRIRQHARTGTKAYVRWIETGQLDAVWAPSMRLNRGQIMPASGHHGHGPHHGEEVFYIHRTGPTVRRRTYKGWARHEGRRVREGRDWPKPAELDEDLPF